MRPKFLLFVFLLLAALIALAIVRLGFIKDARPTQIDAVAVPLPPRTLLWKGDFDDPNWRAHFAVRQEGEWGSQNMQVIPDPTGQFAKVLRVRYPRGSGSPTMVEQGIAVSGGGQFNADMRLLARDQMFLRYAVRFANNFDFVQGGKLPGLFGGTAENGGQIPDGTNGFSTRFMWRADGAGESYVYMPTCSGYGTSIGRGTWSFTPGKWYTIEQELTLNTPGIRNGRLRVWIDSDLKFDVRDLLFRTTPNLKIEGLFFSTFFGGNDAAWKSTRNTYADFAEFSVAEPYVPPMR